MIDVRISLRNIGNSKGIIIPAAVLKQCGIDDAVELEVDGSKITLEPAAALRAGWFDGYDPTDDIVVFSDDFDAETIDEWVWE